MKIKLARCLILSGSWVWPDFVETILSGNGASEYSPRGTRSVPRDAPMGRQQGAELLTAQNTRVPNVTLRSAHRGAPKGRFGTIRLGENSVNMPSVLANTSTDPSQECALFFQKRKIRDFAGPWGTPPKSPYESHVWRPLTLGLGGV